METVELNRRDFLARLMQAAAAVPVTYSFIGTWLWVPPTKVLSLEGMMSLNICNDFRGVAWTLENVIHHNYLDAGMRWAKLTFVKA